MDYMTGDILPLVSGQRIGVSHQPWTYSACQDLIATANDMLEYKRILYLSLECWIGMYHVWPYHYSAPPLRNSDENLTNTMCWPATEILNWRSKAQENTPSIA